MSSFKSQGLERTSGEDLVKLSAKAGSLQQVEQESAQVALEYLKESQND